MTGAFRPAGEDGSDAGGERFAFASGHFGKASALERKRARELNIEGAQTDLALGDFADRRQRRSDQFAGVAPAPAELNPEIGQALAHEMIGHLAPGFRLRVDRVGFAEQPIEHRAAPLIPADPRMDLRIQPLVQLGGRLMADAAIFLGRRVRH